MEFYIKYQQHEIEKLSEELKIKSDQVMNWLLDSYERLNINSNTFILYL